MEELIPTLAEAIILQKERIDDLSELLELLKDETLSNQKEIFKLKESIEKHIEDIIIQTQKMIDKIVIPEAVEVGADDTEITSATKGLILRSANGSRFRLTINNDGSLQTTGV